MKKLILIVLILAGAGYYFYDRKINPAEIENPYFAEMNIKFKVEGRDLSMVVYGKMVDPSDCRARGQNAMRKLFEECPVCSVVDYHCKAELPQSALVLFDKAPTYLSYIAADRGNRHERDVRMIVWGLTKEESKLVCNSIIPAAKKNYTGPISCVEPLQSF